MLLKRSSMYVRTQNQDPACLPRSGYERLGVYVRTSGIDKFGQGLY